MNEAAVPTNHGIRRFWWGVLRPLWVSVRWPVISTFAFVALVLGFIGFDNYSEVQGARLSGWDKFYLSLQLFGLESGNVQPPVPVALHIARLLAPFVAAYAAVSALTAIFREQLAQTKVRWSARDHVIVCGLEGTGHLLAQGFRRRNYRVVVIEMNPNSGAIRQCREQGAAVLIGDPTDRALLSKARVDRARYVFAVANDDGANAQVAINARDLVATRRGAPLTCFVQVLDVDLAELVDADMAMRSSGAFRLEFFNPSERGAPALLNDHPPFDEAGSTPFGPPHVLVVGLGQMGSRLLLHMARRWKAIVEQEGVLLQVSVVDDDAVRHVESLLIRHPELEKACQFVPYVMDTDSSEFERGDFLFDEDGRHVTSVYVCLGDDTPGLAAALRIRHHLKGRGVAIVVRTKQLGGLGTLVGEAADQYEELQVFGLIDVVCRPEVLLAGRTEILARAIHEEYVRKRSADGQTVATNASMMPWDELSEDRKEDSRRHADDIGNKLRAIGRDIEPLTEWGAVESPFEAHEIELLAELEHDRWMKAKLADGASWGARRIRDPRAEIHPALLPWRPLTATELAERFGAEEAARIGPDVLPQSEKEKDRELIRGIPVFLAKAGFRIVERRGRDDEAE